MKWIVDQGWDGNYYDLNREGRVADIICRVASPLGDGAPGQLSLLPLLVHHEHT